jgi:prepilin-type N-terminal cleavage/methylation domain-containing protein
MDITLKKNNGLTLIELLVAMVISAILIAAIYQTFIGQQKTYVVQEQVVDMQQNIRAAINKMMREIRMAGFGNVSNLLPLAAFDGPFKSIINHIDNKNNVNQNDDQLTIIGAFEKVSTLATDHTTGTNVIQLSVLPKDSFNLENRKYICIGGLESHTITNIDESKKEITLNGNLITSHKSGTPVFKVKAITYQLRWDNSNPKMPVLTREDNTDGGGSQVVAENIESLQLRYILDDDTEFDSPAEADRKRIRMVWVEVKARTRIPDIELRKEGKVFKQEYRRRTITSNILVRNNLNP